MDQAPNNSEHQVAEWVDARGLLCPLPLLRARQTLADLAPGDIIAVRTTDPHAELDFEVFCLRTGHQLIERQATEQDWTFWLRKVASPKD